ncbi:MAG: O-antigen ligase family protein, partial [Candidatus Omnitrophica bacterium]|nr:O-antigen ligase family protein [Candidatus Omnitrophota bacterium]
LFFKIMQVWYWWTYLILLAIAVLKAKSNLWRWLGMIFLTVVLVLGGEYLYHRPRAHFVSVFGAVIFLVFYFGFLLVKWRRYVAVSGLFITFFLFVLGFFILGNRNDVHSVTSLKSVIDTYREFEKRYRAQEVGFVPEKLTSHLYNKKKFSDVFPPDFSVFSEVSHEASPVGSPVLSSQQKSSLSHLMYGYVQNGRSLQLNENNIVFRLFVWRDMYREFIHTPQAWLTGFSFGHPQRSKSLEVLGWAKGEWSRDGWITPHNSFLHIIYRAGILGVGMIGALFFMMAKLIRDFYRMNSIEGGLLMAILIYWMVVSNFFVILEFPYNAIVIWPLFGIAWAYRDQLKEQTTK